MKSTLARYCAVVRFVLFFQVVECRFNYVASCFVTVPREEFIESGEVRFHEFKDDVVQSVAGVDFHPSRGVLVLCRVVSEVGQRGLDGLVDIAAACLPVSNAGESKFEALLS